MKRRMSATLETIEARVGLLASLDAECEAEAAWDAVADEREKLLESGAVQAVPLDVAMARLQARFP